MVPWSMRSVFTRNTGGRLMGKLSNMDQIKLLHSAWAKKLAEESTRRSIFHQHFWWICKHDCQWPVDIALRIKPVITWERMNQVEDEYYSLSGPKRGAVERIAKRALKDLNARDISEFIPFIESLIGRYYAT